MKMIKYVVMGLVFVIGAFLLYSLYAEAPLFMRLTQMGATPITMLLLVPVLGFPVLFPVGVYSYVPSHVLLQGVQVITIVGIMLFWLYAINRFFVQHGKNPLVYSEMGKLIGWASVAFTAITIVGSTYQWYFSPLATEQGLTPYSSSSFVQMVITMFPFHLYLLSGFLFVVQALHKDKDVVTK